MKSNSVLEDLLKIIKSSTGLTQEGIADRIGYKREYLSQAKKTDSSKLIKALQTNFKEEINKFKNEVMDTEKDGKDLTAMELKAEQVLQVLDRMEYLMRQMTSNLESNTDLILQNQSLMKTTLFGLAQQDAPVLEMDAKVLWKKALQTADTIYDDLAAKYGRSTLKKPSLNFGTGV